MAVEAYSILLTGALVAVILAWALLVPGLLAAPERAGRRGRRRSLLLAAAVTALILGSLSIAIHAVSGHGPGSAVPMGARALAAAHPAPFVIGTAAIVAIVLAGRLAARRRDS